MNPIYEQYSKTNSSDFMTRFLQFKNSFNGNPQQIIQQMLNRGQITQEQLNEAMKTANQLSRYFK